MVLVEITARLYAVRVKDVPGIIRLKDGKSIDQNMCVL